MKANKPLFPEYRGLEFWITDHRGETLYNEEYPLMYHLRDPKTGWQVASGAYRTKAEASRAAFARIENMTF